MSSGDIEAPLILRMEATLTRLERQMAKGRKVVNDSVNSMQGKFDGMNRHISKSAEASAKTMIRGLDRAEAGYKRVVAAVDPVAAATQRLTGREAALTEAVKRGIITQEEHLRVLKMVRAENTASVAALSRMTGGSVAATAGMRGFLNISGGGRFVLQNTAAQLSDMAVQWEMGTNASRIASQQIPQLLGGFGALGGVLGVVAPLLGVVAAVGIPVGALLYNLGKDAGEGADGLTDLEKALNKAEAAMNKADAAIKRASQGGVEDLLAIYGDVTEKVQGLAQALADIEVRAMVQQVEISLSEALKTELPFEIKSKISIADAIMASTAEEIELVKKEISYLEQEIDNALAPNASSLDLLREYREELALMTGDFANAGSLIDQLQFDPATLVRIRELAELIPNMLKSENFAESADLLAEFRKLAEEVGIEMSEGWGAGLTNAESMLRKVIMHMDESKQLASELGETSVSGGITVAANEALRLARWLGVSLKSAMRLAEMGPQGMPTQGNRGRGSSSGQGQFVSGFDVSEADEFLESYKDPSKGRKGGGRSRDASLGVERQLESLKQQIELIGKSRAEVVVLTAKHKLLNAARQRGLDLGVKMIGCDAGSMDPGPYYLGAATSFVSEQATRRDLAIMLEGAVTTGIPMIIGSAGGSGSNPQLAWTRQIIEDIAAEKGLKFRMAVISAEPGRDFLKQKIAAGKTAPLGPIAELTPETVDETARVVAMMGVEPLQAALADGADVV
ncbi:MAG: hypothetical protein JKY94_08025, partial [Rhodobacteraceae bacterium]|nr:hypothetical protein [Paracoccaceae bacterium]